MSRNSLVPNVVCILAAFSCCAAEATPEGVLQRAEWNYEVPAGVRRIVDQGNKRWLLHFPNGTTNDLRELSRTDQYIELQNESTKNVMRLLDGYGMIRRANGTTFRRFTEGRWVSPGTAEASRYVVDLVYFVPSDREPTSHYESKIRAIAGLMEVVFASDLRSKGYAAVGPRFRRQQGRIVVDLVRGQRESRFYNQNGAWKSSAHGDAVFSEIQLRHGDTKRRMTFVFAETYEPGDAPRLWPGHIALAAAQPPTGGVAVFSSWILRDEFASPDPELLRQRFFDQTPIRGRTALGHRGPNSPRSDFLEDGIGGAIHELAHMFALTHHSRGRPNHIMAQGFRDLRWNVGLKSNPRLAATFSKENAAILMTSRFINEAVDRSDHQPPQVDFDVRRAGRRLQAAVGCHDETALSRVTIVEVTAASGRELLVSRQLAGKDQSLQIMLNASPPIRADSSLQAIVIDGGGNFAKATITPARATEFGDVRRGP